MSTDGVVAVEVTKEPHTKHATIQRACSIDNLSVHHTQHITDLFRQN